MRVQTVAVIGAGTMGRSLGEFLAEKGLDVLLIDRTETLAREGLAAIEASLAHRIQRWTITEAEKRVTLSRIRATADIAQAAGADLVIEAVTENLESKRAVFAQLDALCPSGVILASNSSTLSITEIAAATSRPERVIGLHFFNPVLETPVVEMVRGLRTTDATVLAARSFLQRIGKTGVEVYESPGYVTTRVAAPMLNEAMYALMEGVASAEDIDTAVRLAYEWPRGPLEMADRMGLDTLLRIMEALFREFGELKYRPCPLLRKYVRAGHLGTKVGQGFFRYDSDGNRIAGPAGGAEQTRGR